MTEKYCSLPKSICEFGAGEKADCENCELNRRFSKRTIDNWESYIVDNKTEKEYGTDINRLLDLLNGLASDCSRLEKENEQLLEFKKRYDKLLVDYNNLACRFDELNEGNMEFKRLLRKISDSNGRIWLMNGGVYDLKKIFGDD